MGKAFFGTLLALGFAFMVWTAIEFQRECDAFAASIGGRRAFMRESACYVVDVDGRIRIMP